MHFYYTLYDGKYDCTITIRPYFSYSVLCYWTTTNTTVILQNLFWVQKIGTKICTWVGSHTVYHLPYMYNPKQIPITMVVLFPNIGNPSKTNCCCKCKTDDDLQYIILSIYSPSGCIVLHNYCKYTTAM